MSKAVEVFEGARVLMSFGPAVVVEVGRHGVTVKDVLGENHFVRADQLAVTGIGEDGLDAIHLSIQPWWNSLSPEIKMEVRLKLEVVFEVLTGYRDGHPLMAREGEPFYPFGKGFDASLTQRIEAMARQLTFEYGVDRTRVRRVLAGEIIRTACPRTRSAAGSRRGSAMASVGWSTGARPRDGKASRSSTRDSCGWSTRSSRPSTAPRAG